MENRGIMAEIRYQLSQGKTAKELISQGFKRGSVNKARWQMRKRGELPDSKPQSQGVEGTLEWANHDDGYGGLIWHPDSPIPCPDCNTPVKHWDICPHCSKLIPGGCNCNNESHALTEGFTFVELQEAILN